VLVDVAGQDDRVAHAGALEAAERAVAALLVGPQAVDLDVDRVPVVGSRKRGARADAAAHPLVVRDLPSDADRVRGQRLLAQRGGAGSARAQKGTTGHATGHEIRLPRSSSGRCRGSSSHRPARGCRHPVKLARRRNRCPKVPQPVPFCHETAA
jgi:hypothetical protein